MNDLAPLAFAGLIGLAIGLVAGGAVVYFLHRARSAARVARWERRFEALETEVGTARFDHARALEEKEGLEADLAALRKTLDLLRDEVEAQRAFAAQAHLDRDLANRRVAAAVDELAAARMSLEEAEATRAMLDARLRELKPLTDQRTALAARIGEQNRLLAEVESDRTRLAVMVQSLEQQLRQSVGANREEQDRLEAGRALMSAQLRERRRQLEESRAMIARIEAELATARSALATQSTRAEEAEATLRAVELSRQEMEAEIAAERGALMAQVERLEPLRRQLADREELLRSMARERDDAASALVRRERELGAEIERITGQLAEATRRAARIGELDARIAELEGRIGVTARARDDHQAAERQLRAQVEWLTAELKDRDQRFRVLLEDRRAAVESAREEVARLREDLDRLRSLAAGGETPAPAEPVVEAPAAVSGNGSSGNGHHPESTRDATAAIVLANATEPIESGPAGGDITAVIIEDDLQRISGIGPAIARVLRSRGVVTFRQIASWSDEDIERFARDLGAFRTRIRRDRWVEQARREHEIAHGERL